VQIAIANPDMFPIEINEADYDDLIRVPGIGPQSAFRINKVLEEGHRFTRMRELKNLGVVLKRASTFISVNGSKQTSIASFQTA